VTQTAPHRSDGAAPPATEPDPGTGPDPGGDVSTRERILDISLELFSDQGYERTSLRQIAERLGFSKAAIYYHFASKEEILLALHLRLHEFGRSALEALDGVDWTPAVWSSLLDQLIDQMLEHRALFVLHERNRAALEELHQERHDAEHDDLEARFREALSNPAITLRDRVRMASAFGAVMGTVVLTGETFADVPSDELRGLLRGVVGDLLAPTTGP
jgi:AcrR family transcriptional regulator